MKLTLFCRGLLLLLCLSACEGFFPAPAPSSTPIAPTLSPSATILWFPATNTATPFPTQTILATPEQRPGIGGLLFTDIFDQPELWNISNSDWASATILRDRLVLSITGSGPLSIVSLRSQPVLDNFYAQVTVLVNLCSSRDEFGMVFRAASSGNHYRYALNCNGEVRLERGSSAAPVPMVDWIPSGDAPLGAPAELRLGIWAYGREMRFFINDRYQFSSRDSQIGSGTLGFFAFASGSTPVTVSFSDLSANSVAYIPSTPTIPPTPTR